LHSDLSVLEQKTIVPLAIAFGGAFGLIALLLIETMRGLEKALRRVSQHPYMVAAGGGAVLALFYVVVGDQYAGLGTPVIEASLAGTAKVVVLAFFIGATSGAALAAAAGLPTGVFAAFGFVSVLAAAANTPIAAAVMGMELLPTQLGVYAALCAGTAFLIVGHRSVYASQKLGFAKSAGLEVPLDVPVEEGREAMRVRRGSLTELVHNAVIRRKKKAGKPSEN
jgi:H+/Cl- antiporter ClcA